MLKLGYIISRLHGSKSFSGFLELCRAT